MAHVALSPRSQRSAAAVPTKCPARAPPRRTTLQRLRLAPPTVLRKLIDHSMNRQLKPVLSGLQADHKVLRAGNAWHI
jgi:hypothetical protein